MGGCRLVRSGANSSLRAQPRIERKRDLMPSVVVPNCQSGLAFSQDIPQGSVKLGLAKRIVRLLKLPWLDPRTRQQ